MKNNAYQILNKSLSKFPPEIPNPGFKYAYLPILLSDLSEFSISSHSAPIFLHIFERRLEVEIDDIKKRFIEILINSDVL